MRPKHIETIADMYARAADEAERLNEAEREIFARRGIVAYHKKAVDAEVKRLTESVPSDFESVMAIFSNTDPREEI